MFKINIFIREVVIIIIRFLVFIFLEEKNIYLVYLENII